MTVEQQRQGKAVRCAVLKQCLAGCMQATESSVGQNCASCICTDFAQRSVSTGVAAPANRDIANERRYGNAHLNRFSQDNMVDPIMDVGSKKKREKESLDSHD